VALGVFFIATLVSSHAIETGSTTALR